MNAPSRVFRYALDPVCMGSMMLYVIGRLFLKPHHLGGVLVRDYLNDVLCLPIFLPMILWAHRRLRLRPHDCPPQLWEVLQSWLVFSIIFELILPRFPQYFRSTSDRLDVIAYLVGGVIAFACWNHPSPLHRGAAAS